MACGNGREEGGMDKQAWRQEGCDIVAERAMV